MRCVWTNGREATLRSSSKWEYRSENKAAEKHRAVKVSFGNSSTVHQILIKAKELRLSQCFKTVFISPDRSPEERAVHKQLVLDLKRKVTENPNKRYFIRTGKICEIDEWDTIVYFFFNKIDITYFLAISISYELLHFTFTGNIHAFWSLNYHFCHHTSRFEVGNFYFS